MRRKEIRASVQVCVCVCMKFGKTAIEYLYGMYKLVATNVCMYINKWIFLQFLLISHYTFYYNNNVILFSFHFDFSIFIFKYVWVF